MAVEANEISPVCVVDISRSPSPPHSRRRARHHPLRPRSRMPNRSPAVGMLVSVQNGQDDARSACGVRSLQRVVRARAASDHDVPVGVDAILCVGARRGGERGHKSESSASQRGPCDLERRQPAGSPADPARVMFVIHHLRGRPRPTGVVHTRRRRPLSGRRGRDVREAFPLSRLTARQRDVRRSAVGSSRRSRRQAGAALVLAGTSSAPRHGTASQLLPGAVEGARDRGLGWRPPRVSERRRR